MNVLLVVPDAQAASTLRPAMRSEGPVTMDLESVHGPAAALARLREQAFDAAMLLHLPPRQDAFPLFDAIQAAKIRVPILLLDAPSQTETCVAALQRSVDAYVPLQHASAQSLCWQLLRAVECKAISAEHDKLRSLRQRQLEAEHHEASRLLEQQRQIIGELDAFPLAPALRESKAPESHIVRRRENYREVLRAYVIMGSGAMRMEIQELAEAWAGDDLSPHEAMQVHIEAVEDLLRSVGQRGVRHIMARAEMLILEVALHLAEAYQTRPSDSLKAA